MAMNDPISDMLTRIRNGLRARHADVIVPHSRLKEQICLVLEKEGYIEEHSVAGDKAQKTIRVVLRYGDDGRPVIHGLRRVSKPSLRVYAGHGEMKQVRSGLGVAIVSTSKGLITGKQCRAENVGGEILCEVW